MSQSTAVSRSKPVNTKPEKPDGCPLFPHASGRWARKICGQLRYFGKWDDLEGALARHAEESDEWNAGRVKHRGIKDEFLVRDLANLFLTAKTAAAKNGSITAQTLHDYHRGASLSAGSCGPLIA